MFNGIARLLCEIMSIEDIEGECCPHRVQRGAHAKKRVLRTGDRGRLGLDPRILLAASTTYTAQRDKGWKQGWNGVGEI